MSRAAAEPTEPPFHEGTPIKTTVKTLAMIVGLLITALGAWFTLHASVANNVEEIKTVRTEAHREVESLRSDMKERLDAIRTEQQAQRTEQQQQRDILMRIDERTARMNPKP